MKWIAFPLFLACLGAAPGTATFESRQAQTVRRAIDAAAAGYMADRCHVGLSVVASVGGQSFLMGYGSTRRDRVARPTPDSVYELASVTKTFTGALAADAIVRGRMTLDGDFRAYLRGNYPNLAKDGRPITLRDLATHRSGLQRDLPDSDAVLTHPDPDHVGAQLTALNKGFGRAQSLTALHGVTLRTIPGTDFAYSNIGIRVIGYGLETAQHAPLDQLLRRRILGPLKMTDSGFALTPSMRRRLVTPYNRNGRAQPYHDDSAGAAYGLFSTPRDMARYLAWQLDERDPVIRRAHAVIHGTAKDGQGLIWNIGEDDGARMLWHGGGTFGMTSQMVLFPGDGMGFVLLANDSCEGSEGALKGIAVGVRRAVSSYRTSVLSRNPTHQALPVRASL